MAEYKMKNFTYRCSCGFSLSVFLDAGMPQETARCRSCNREITRELVD
ncbi:MAG TPA: hypothetical protein PKM65_16375 [Spirochaetota bacterium]|nr:hypothetical protein [Spirochaetota bacterium]HNT11768.1 hypothetical protein [Spirochaetota bacterium]